MNRKTENSHSEACCIQIYGKYQQNNRAKWRAVRQQMEKTHPQPEVHIDDIVMNGNFRDDLPKWRAQLFQNVWKWQGNL